MSIRVLSKSLVKDSSCMEDTTFMNKKDKSHPRISFSFTNTEKHPVSNNNF